MCVCFWLERNFGIEQLFITNGRDGRESGKSWEGEKRLGGKIYTPRWWSSEDWTSTKEKHRGKRVIAE